MHRGFLFFHSLVPNFQITYHEFVTHRLRVPVNEKVISNGLDPPVKTNCSWTTRLNPISRQISRINHLFQLCDLLLTQLSRIQRCENGGNSCISQSLTAHSSFPIGRFCHIIICLLLDHGRLYFEDDTKSVHQNFECLLGRLNWPNIVQIFFVHLFEGTCSMLHCRDELFHLFVQNFITYLGPFQFSFLLSFSFASQNWVQFYPCNLFVKLVNFLFYLVLLFDKIWRFKLQSWQSIFD